VTSPSDLNPRHYYLRLETLNQTSHSEYLQDRIQIAPIEDLGKGGKEGEDEGWKVFAAVRTDSGVVVLSAKNWISLDWE
jgi:hypothetical protein